MGKLHNIQVNGVDHVVNFNSYAVMQAYKKYGAEGLETVMQSDPFSFLFDMLKFGLSDNGRKEWSESEVYDLIDGMGGINSEGFIQLSGWMREAFETPESSRSESKKNEEVSQG